MPLYLLRCPRSCHLRFKPHYKAQCTLPTTTPTQEPSHRLALPRPAHLSSLFLPRQLPSSGRPSLPNLLTSNPESHPSQRPFSPWRLPSCIPRWMSCLHHEPSMWYYSWTFSSLIPGAQLISSFDQTLPPAPATTPEEVTNPAPLQGLAMVLKNPLWKSAGKSSQCTASSGPHSLDKGLAKIQASCEGGKVGLPEGVHGASVIINRKGGREKNVGYFEHHIILSC